MGQGSSSSPGSANAGSRAGSQPAAHVPALPPQGVFIAGNYTTDPKKSQRKEGARGWDGEGDTRGDLGGTQKDVLDFSAFVKGQGCDTLVFDREGHLTPKSEVVAALRAMFHKDAPAYIVQYAGHGRKPDGAWCFENAAGEICEYLTFEEFLGMWRSSPAKGRHLSVMLDSCFSGAWVEKARAQWKVHGDDVDGSGNIQAACTQTEVALEDAQGGRFTQWLLEMANSGQNPSPYMVQTQGVLGVNTKQHPQLLRIECEHRDGAMLHFGGMTLERGGQAILHNAELTQR